MRFSKRSFIPATAADVFRWHSLPGALDRLLPPWESIQITKRGAGLEAGTEVVLVNRLGPLRLRWVARHTDCEPGHRFRDVQDSGPFRRWEHSHVFRDAERGCEMEDVVDYELPGGSMGQWLAGSFVDRKISAMFDFRHQRTIDDLVLHQQYAAERPLRVALTGSHGLIGNQLRAFLSTGGHEVIRLVRPQSGEDPGRDDVVWDPTAATNDLSALEGVDAVVHLGGENIAARRWSPAVKERIRSSRVAGTYRLCEALARLRHPPRVLLAASGTGIYGDREDEMLDELSSAGSDWLADVARQWEAATHPAAEAGIRVVNLRFGLVLSPRGGALPKMLTPMRTGLGGRLGNGRQYWSWISLDDAIGAAYHALVTKSVQGPINLAAPESVTNADFTKTLGDVLRRPSFLPAPAFALRAMLGEMADRLLLSSTRVVPRRLLESGYQFRYPDLESTLRFQLGATGS